MKKFIVSIVLGVCSLISQAQNVISPSGGGTVSFGSAGGGWQRAVITDQPTGEVTEAYSLEAEIPGRDVEVTRHPSIMFSCKQSKGFSGVRIRTGSLVASEHLQTSGRPYRQTHVLTWTDHQKSHIWTVNIAANGSDLLFDKRIMSELMMHTEFSIRYVSAGGDSITDEYITKGLAADSLKADCVRIFK